MVLRHIRVIFIFGNKYLYINSFLLERLRNVLCLMSKFDEVMLEKTRILWKVTPKIVM